MNSKILIIALLVLVFISMTGCTNIGGKATKSINSGNSSKENGFSKTECDDTDGGVPEKEIYIFGTAYNDFNKISDYCLDKIHLMEAKCIDGNVASEFIKCPNEFECNNGACVKASILCTDSDGNNLFVQGTTIAGKEKFIDKCDNNTVIEGTCYRSNNGWELHRTNYVCPTNYTCENGACVEDTNNIDLAVLDINLSNNNPQVGETITIATKIKNIGDQNTEFSYSITFGDGFGEEPVMQPITAGEERIILSHYHWNENGLFTITARVFTNNNDVNESNNSLSIPITVIQDENMFCNDSDGGLNFEVKGTVTTDFNSFTDYCDSNILKEGYCDSNNSIKIYSKNCLDLNRFCSTGKCTDTNSN